MPQQKAIAWVYNPITRERTNIYDGYIEDNQFFYKSGGFDIILLGKVWAKDEKPLSCKASMGEKLGKNFVVRYKDDGKDLTQIDSFAGELYHQRSPSDHYKGAESSLKYRDSMIQNPDKNLKDIVTILMFIALATGIFLNYLQGQAYQNATQNLIGPMNKSIQFEAHVLPILINDTANNTHIIAELTTAIKGLTSSGG